MILDCPSCRARYLVQIGHFAAGGRQVRCARCKHQWQAMPPTKIDVFQPAQHAIGYHPHPSALPASGPDASSPHEDRFSHPLPVVVTKGLWRRLVKALSLAGIVTVTLIFGLIMVRQPIVNKFPILKGLYEAVGLHIDHSGKGLVFQDVRSELKYDGGTMRLFVDGVIHNSTQEIQLIPDIKARALGPDQHIIQSWWVPAPAATVAIGGNVPFHTEVNAPMKSTIEDVYLEFYSQDEPGDVNQ